MSLTGLLTLDQAIPLTRQAQSAGQRVVITNGCFDMLHVGHVRSLTMARSLGDMLLVGLNDDASVRVLKGPGRPVNHARDRAEVLLALRAVDVVVLFAELDARALLAALRPDIYVKGADYAEPDAPRDRVLHYSVDGTNDTRPLSAIAGRLNEAPVVAAYGGAVALLPYIAGYSTTEIIARSSLLA